METNWKKFNEKQDNKSEKDIWWDENYKRLIAFTESPIALDIVRSISG